MMRTTWIVCGWLVLSFTAQAASFDCGKAGTKVEHIICGDAEISKLDEELSAAYKTAVQDKQQADSIKQAQKQWMKERNNCKDAACVKEAYAVRLMSFADREKEVDSAAPDPFKGEYILMRAWPGAKVCQRFKDNLNRFRKLDFDQCNPRLSDKFPEFSRPYQWEEIPFDMALAEKAIRGTSEYFTLLEKNNTARVEYERKLGEERWQEWKKGSEPFRAAGTAHMWTTKIDIDGDGVEDTLLRMVPGGRFRIDPERPSLWSCDYNIGELYLIESANLKTMASFTSVVGGGLDIVHFAADNHYYLLRWDTGPASNNGWFNQPVPGVGGTRGLVIRALPSPAEICLIDWVPTGRYIPAAQPKHTPDTH